MAKLPTGVRSRNLYSPGSLTPFKISRTKIDLFLKCPRCFYLNIRLGVAAPGGPPFTLNNAVDHRMKEAFDEYRARKRPHPIMKAFGIKAIPFAHEKLEEWRDSRKRGIQCLHQGTNLLIAGGIDDLWSSGNTIFVVEYKATSRNGEVSIDEAWQIGYKRQVEVYQYILRQQGFRVSDTAYFVYGNGRASPSPDIQLDFEMTIIPYLGNCEWVEGAIFAIYECLESPLLPPRGPKCEHCAYRHAAMDVELAYL